MTTYSVPTPILALNESAIGILPKCTRLVCRFAKRRGGVFLTRAIIIYRRMRSLRYDTIDLTNTDRSARAAARNLSLVQKWAHLYFLFPAPIRRSNRYVIRSNSTPGAKFFILRIRPARSCRLYVLYTINTVL